MFMYKMSVSLNFKDFLIYSGVIMYVCSIGDHLPWVYYISAFCIYFYSMPGRQKKRRRLQHLSLKIKFGRILSFFSFIAIFIIGVVSATAAASFFGFFNYFRLSLPARITIEIGFADGRAAFDAEFFVFDIRELYFV